MKSRRLIGQSSIEDRTLAWRELCCAAQQNRLANVCWGSFTSLWLLRSTVRMSASHPKATESLRSSEMTLSANRRHGVYLRPPSNADHDFNLAGALIEIAATTACRSAFKFLKILQGYSHRCPCIAQEILRGQS